MKRILYVALAVALPISAQAQWQQDEKALAWKNGEQTVWRYSFDLEKGKPFFDPLSIRDARSGTRLTNFRPEDHPWHYGLWFSWKYINEANYWEENRESGKAQGSTRWSTPEIQTRGDGSASIRMSLTYTHPTGRVDLTENRVLEVSAPDQLGRYTIDWSSHFTAGKEGAVLDRTPMPGEPKGAFNGGYAGLAARLAGAPLSMSVVSTAGPITEFATDRARPNAPAVASNFNDAGKAVGSIAVLAHPSNIVKDAPWYIINAEDGMRFICSAVLAPAIRKLPANGKWDLNYRIIVQSEPFTPATLRTASEAWVARSE